MVQEYSAWQRKRLPVTGRPGEKNYEAQLKPLFLQSLQGNRMAYGTLLAQVCTLAKAFARSRMSNHADCDDVAQEILLSVHKALPTYDPERPCMPWLAAIMHYRITDWMRSRYTAAEQLKIPLEAVEDFLEADVTEPGDAREYLKNAMESLTGGQKAVIAAMYGEDMSVAETAQKLGLSVSAVKVTAHRAYKKLRKQLEGKK